MQIITRHNWEKDALIECDCGCSFLRLTIFDDRKDSIYFCLYGAPYNQGHGEMSRLDAKELGIKLANLGEESFVFISNPLEIHYVAGDAFVDFEIDDGRDGITLQLKQAKELGKMLIEWSEVAYVES